MCMRLYLSVCVYYRDKREPLKNIKTLIEVGFEEHLGQKKQEYSE